MAPRQEDYEESTEIALPALFDRASGAFDVQPGASLEKVQEADLPIANAVLEAIVSSWRHIHTVSGVCRLAAATFSAIEHRRRVMGHPYGVQPTAQAKLTVYPID